MSLRKAMRYSDHGIKCDDKIYLCFALCALEGRAPTDQRTGGYVNYDRVRIWQQEVVSPFQKSKTGCVGRPYLFTVQIVLFPLCQSHFCRVGGAGMLSRIFAHIIIGSMFRHKAALKFHLSFLRFVFSRWCRITLPSSDVWHCEGWCVITDVSDKHTVPNVFPDEGGSTFLWGVSIKLPYVLFHA